MKTRSLIYFFAAIACSDPVTSGALDSLPPEDPNVPIGEFHRAGQPCVDCHSPSGPASADDFSLGGTVFAQQANLVGVDQATVAFTDTTGSQFTTMTNCVGNFFVKKSDWDPSFPIFARVFKGNEEVTMQGQIGRERSCANCHSDPDPTTSEYFSNVGHIYLYPATVTAPPPSNDCPVSPVLQ